MVDFALAAEREQGMRPRDAIYQACLLRFRPILMTTMSAMFGALPLVLSNGTGSELRRPLGITIVGGLIFSQALTLYTTPVVYLYFDRLRLWWENRRAQNCGRSAGGFWIFRRRHSMKTDFQPQVDTNRCGGLRREWHESSKIHFVAILEIHVKDILSVFIRAHPWLMHRRRCRYFRRLQLCAALRASAGRNACGFQGKFRHEHLESRATERCHSSQQLVDGFQ